MENPETQKSLSTQRKQTNKRRKIKKMSNTHDTEKPGVNPVLANGTFKSPVVWRMLKLMSFSSRYSWRIMKVVTLTSFVTIYYKHDESGGIKPDPQDIPVVEQYMIKE